MLPYNKREPTIIRIEKHIALETLAGGFLRRIILSTIKDVESDIVMGMVCLESSHLSYIQYIDTSALCSKRLIQTSITKHVVREYIKSQLSLQKSIYLFAAAKPSLLFTGSDMIHNKRPLPPVKLINWWIKCLEPFENVYVYSPFEERINSDRLEKRISKILKWTYGLPFGLNIAADEIPIFDKVMQDDPKWRHFQCMRKSGNDFSKMTAASFWSSMQLRDEFRQNASSFFFVKAQGSQYTDDFEKDGNKDYNEIDCNSLILKFCQSLSWSSLEDGKSSSKILIKKLKCEKSYVMEISEIEIIDNIFLKVNDSSTDENNTPRDLQGLVRCKKQAK